MRLPKLPRPINKIRSTCVSLGGLNLTENTRDGQLRDSVGLSTEKYPCLTQSMGREKESILGLADDIFKWNENVVTARDGVLYLDGEALCNVQTGKKQFAVINTSLVVWPDRLIVDLTNKTVFRLGGEAENKGLVTYTKNGISFSKNDTPAATIKQLYSTKGHFGHWIMWSCGSAVFDEETESWTLSDTKLDTMYTSVERIYIPMVEFSTQTNSYIFSRPSATVWDRKTYPTLEQWKASPAGKNFTEPEPGNNIGAYATVKTTGYMSVDGDEIEATFELHLQRPENKYDWNNLFRLYDKVSVSGSKYGLFDGEKTVTGISESGLDFAESFSVFPLLVAEKSKIAWTAGKSKTLYGKIKNYYYKIEVKAEDVPQNAVLLIENFVESNKYENDVLVWDQDSKSVIKTIKCRVNSYVPEDEEDEDDPVFEEFTHDDSAVRVKREMPELDFICESENRLWGVCNKTHTIHASALGLAYRFNDYEGISTDSYTVAVASEGDFTGIAAYGGGVCCFKENRMHKVLGSYPSEYYINEYEIAGVQKGSSRSICLINEVLYYKGVRGVYAYSGGVPKLMSQDLGSDIFTGGCAGSDGVRYYISMKNKDGESGLYCYDTLHNMWMKESSEEVLAFAGDGEDMHILTESGVFVVKNRAQQWSASFVPFDRADPGKKGYSRLRICADMSAGSYINVLIANGKEKARPVYSRTAETCGTISIPLPIGRSDSFAVKICGSGDVLLRSITREYTEEV